MLILFALACHALAPVSAPEVSLLSPDPVSPMEPLRLDARVDAPPQTPITWATEDMLGVQTWQVTTSESGHSAWWFAPRVPGPLNIGVTAVGDVSVDVWAETEVDPPPTLILLVPQDGAVVHDQVRVQALVRGAEQVEVLVVETGERTIPSWEGEMIFAELKLEPGDWTVEVYAIDEAGNHSRAEAEVRLDP